MFTVLSSRYPLLSKIKSFLLKKVGQVYKLSLGILLASSQFAREEHARTSSALENSGQDLISGETETDGK